MEYITTLQLVDNLEHAIENYKGPISIDDNYEMFNIFDWFRYNLNLSDLKSMASFVKLVRRLGYDNEIVFKVGASGCGNGMWGKDKEENMVFRSFTPDYTEYAYIGTTKGDDYVANMNRTELVRYVGRLR